MYCSCKEYTSFLDFVCKPLTIYPTDLNSQREKGSAFSAEQLLFKQMDKVNNIPVKGIAAESRGHSFTYCTCFSDI